MRRKNPAEPFARGPDAADAGDRPDWPTRITVTVGAAAGMALALLIEQLADLRSFWLDLVGIAVGISAGIVLGRLVAARIFRRPRKEK
jgi:hypothetical protein